MAYLTDPNLDEEDQNQAGAPPQAKGLGGEGGIIGAGAPQATGGGANGQAKAQQGGQPAPTSSGAWTNLNRYLDANQGADARMGQGVRGVADTRAGDYQQKAQGVETAGRQGAQAATVTDSGVVGQLKAIGSGQGAQGLKKDAFEKQYNAAYSGPQAASDTAGWGDAQTAVGKVQGMGQMASQGQAGRESLLNETYGTDGQRYQQGEKRLDSFILGGGQAGNQAVEKIGQDYGKYGENFQNLSRMLDDTYGKAKSATEATRLATRSAADEAKGALGGRFDQAALDATAKSKAADEAYKKYAAGDADSLKAAGLSDDDLRYMKSMGYDVSKIATAGKGYKAGDLVSDGDRLGYEELMGALGESPAYDLSKGGGSDTAINAEQLAALKGASTMDRTLKDRLAKAQTDRTQSVNDAFQAFGGNTGPMSAEKVAQTFSKAGISPEDAAAAKTLGINPYDYFGRDRALDLGDVAGADGDAYQKLLATLGMSGRVNTADRGDEGSGWGFDKDRFMADVAARMPAAAPPPAATESVVPKRSGVGYDAGRLGDSNKKRS
jgi:hypothetical protein